MGNSPKSGPVPNVSRCAKLLHFHAGNGAAMFRCGKCRSRICSSGKEWHRLVTLILILLLLLLMIVVVVVEALLWRQLLGLKVVVVGLVVVRHE